MINPQWLELLLSGTHFHSSKGLRASEVRLYIVCDVKANPNINNMFGWLVGCFGLNGL